MQATPLFLSSFCALAYQRQARIVETAIETPSYLTRRELTHRLCSRRGERVLARVYVSIYCRSTTVRERESERYVEKGTKKTINVCK